MEFVYNLIMPAAVSLLVAILTFKFKFAKEMEKIDRLFSQQKEFEKIKIEIKKDNANFERTHKMLTALYNIKLNYSITKNYVLETKGADLNEIHQLYLDTANQLNLFKSLVFTFYFDDKIFAQLNDLYGHLNLIWGKQQAYFNPENKEDKDKIRTELFDYLFKLGSKIDDIENNLREILKNMRSNGALNNL